MALSTSLSLGYPNLGPKLLGIKARNDIDLAQQPSKGPPSLRVLGPIQLEVNDHPRAGGFRLGDPYPRAGGFRLLAIQARAGLAGNDAQRTTTHRSHHDAVKKQGSLLHAITYSRRGHRAILRARPNPASSTPPSKAASKETMERRTQDTTLDAVNCHEKEGRYVSPCHVVSRVGRRDSRSHMHATTNTCTRTPPPWSIKGGGKPMQRGGGNKTRREHKSQTHTDHNLGPRSSSPSPTLLVNPYHEQHVTRCIAPLLDVRPRGRNQDKTPSLTLAIRETSG
nr:unnamed protein product [Digitaria exilis]